MDFDERGHSPSFYLSTDSRVGGGIYTNTVLCLEQKRFVSVQTHPNIYFICMNCNLFNLINGQRKLLSAIASLDLTQF